MAVACRWDPCVAHRGEDVDTFLQEYFGRPDRQILFVGGAGFDPRACTVAHRLNRFASGIRALLLREERPNATSLERDRADANTTALRDSVSEAQVESFEIFGTDGAVVGGRNVINVLRGQRIEGVTDIAVDISALSVGTSFPVIRYFVQSCGEQRGVPNLHVFVEHNPDVDVAIRSRATDEPGYVHGFKGGSTLSTAADAARLWLPQVARTRRRALRRLYDFIRPHDTCPILPFPARNPRLGDVLAEEYREEFESAWVVDARNIVYADEGDPLDLYRTILRLYDLRRPVFESIGGSMLTLSPLGSKVMALGALMAALEQDLPVAHLETLGYDIEGIPPVPGESTLIHVWLEGDAYPTTRPPCQTDGGASR